MDEVLTVLNNKVRCLKALREWNYLFYILLYNSDNLVKNLTSI